MLWHLPFLALLSLLLHTHSQDLEPTARRTYPADLLGEWRLVEAELKAVCPGTIQYLGFTRQREGPFRVLHSKILQDGLRCEGSDKRGRGRRLRLYTHVAVNRKLRMPRSTYRVPARLLETLRRRGPARRVRKAMQKSRESYYVGFESATRVCNGSAAFRRGTTAFVLRPREDVSVRKLRTTLARGKKWMVVVGERAKACVYESELNRFARATAEAEEPEAEGTAEGGGENGVELEGSVAGRGECFPGDARVALRSGRAVAMRELQVGDEVAVGAGKHARVHMFTHRSARAHAWFVRVDLVTGESVRASRGHVLYGGDGATVAASVRAGDRLRRADGSYARVQRVGWEQGRGLYHPQTTTGDIVVDGVWATTYTSSVDVRVAHALLAPVRGVFWGMGVDVSRGVLEKGWVW